MTFINDKDAYDKIIDEYECVIDHEKSRWHQCQNDKNRLITIIHGQMDNATKDELMSMPGYQTAYNDGNIISILHNLETICNPPITMGEMSMNNNTDEYKPNKKGENETRQVWSAANNQHEKASSTLQPTVPHDTCISTTTAMITSINPHQLLPSILHPGLYDKHLLKLGCRKIVIPNKNMNEYALRGSTTRSGDHKTDKRCKPVISSTMGSTQRSKQPSLKSQPTACDHLVKRINKSEVKKQPVHDHNDNCEQLNKKAKEHHVHDHDKEAYDVKFVKNKHDDFDDDDPDERNENELFQPTCFTTLIEGSFKPMNSYCATQVTTDQLVCKANDITVDCTTPDSSSPSQHHLDHLNFMNYHVNIQSTTTAFIVFKIFNTVHLSHIRLKFIREYRSLPILFVISGQFKLRDTIQYISTKPLTDCIIMVEVPDRNATLIVFPWMKQSIFSRFHNSTTNYHIDEAHFTHVCLKYNFNHDIKGFHITSFSIASHATHSKATAIYINTFLFERSIGPSYNIWDNTSQYTALTLYRNLNSIPWCSVSFSQFVICLPSAFCAAMGLWVGNTDFCTQTLPFDNNTVYQSVQYFSNTCSHHCSNHPGELGHNCHFLIGNICFITPQ